MDSMQNTVNNNVNMMWGQIASRLIGVSVHSVYKCQVTVLYIKYCQLYFDFFFKAKNFMTAAIEL